MFRGVLDAECWCAPKYLLGIEIDGAVMEDAVAQL